MKKTVTALGLTSVLLFGAAASCNDQEPTDWYKVEFPDCDADDRSPKWEVADCGPSPLPMKTAYQPKPTKKPTPRKTR